MEISSNLMLRVNGDILANIFEWLAVLEEYCPFFAKGPDRLLWPRPLPATHTISQVSQSWRSIALHIPALWRVIQLNTANVPESTIAPLVNLWMARAGDLTLDVLVLCGTDDEDVAAHALPALEVLMSRVRYLVVDIALGDYLPASISFKTLECLLLLTPHLKDCSIYSQDEYWHDIMFYDEALMLPQAPQLRSLDCGQFGVQFIQHLLHNLTTIFIGTMHRLKLDSLQLFRDCPDLHSYGVNDYLVPLRSIEYNALPTVSTLRHITRGAISLFRGRSMRDFENITHLDMRDQDYNRDAAETLRFLVTSSSFARLVSLAISFNDFEHPVVRALLQAASAAREVRVSTNNWFDWLWAARFLASWAKPHNIDFLPRMQILGIRMQSTVSQHVENFGKALAQLLTVREAASLPVAISTCRLYHTRGVIPPSEELLTLLRVASKTVIYSAREPSLMYDSLYDC